MRQTEASECGLICLAIAASQFGSKLDLISLRGRYQISSRGLTLKEIKDIAADMGMVGRAVRCDIDELADLKTPAILHWGLNHFVVLESVSGGKFRINDPRAGVLSLSRSEVSKEFTGVALELAMTADFVRRKERSPLSLATWFHVIPAMYGPLSQLLLLSVLLQLYILATPLYITLAIDQGALKGMPLYISPQRHPA